MANNRYCNLPGSSKISETYDRINAGFGKVQEEMDARIAEEGNLQGQIDAHKASTTAHSADHITYSGRVPATNVKDAIDKQDQRIDNLAASAGDSNTEIVDMRHSAPFNETFPVAGDRVAALEMDTIERGINVKRYGVKGDGVTDDATALSALLTEIGSAEATIILPRGTYIIGSDVTIPDNVTLEFKRGAKLAPVSNVTVTINGTVIAGFTRIFAGDGTISGSMVVDFIPPQWWGAKGDGVTDDTNALMLALEAAYNSGVYVRLIEGTYCYTNLAIYPGTVILGDKRASTILKHIGSGTAIVSGASGNNSYPQLARLTIELNPNTTVGIDWSGCTMGILSDLRISGKGSTGIGIILGRGPEQVKSGYYNSLYDVQIACEPEEPHLNIGFQFIYGANSNRLIGCRTNYVDNPVIIEACNNNSFISNAFEQFVRGIYNNGRNNLVAGNRFEDQSQSNNAIAVELGPDSQENVTIGNNYTNVKLPRILDNSTFRSNQNFDYYIHDSVEIRMRNYPISGAKYVGLQKQTQFFSNPDGTFAYFDAGVLSSGQGLFFRENSSLRKVSLIQSGSYGGRPTNVVTGHEYFDTSLGQPVWWNGTSWMQSGKIVSVPSSATSPGVPGDWAFDTNYLYICYATNSWRRIALSSW